MAKTLRTSGDYTIKTGTGAGGSNYVNFDSGNTRVMGNLIVDGTRTELNTSTLSVEDSSLLLNRNASGADIDSGIMIERDGSNNAAFYWNEGDDVWRAVLTASLSTATTIADTALAKIQVAEPSANSDVATKNYVDTTASGAILAGSTNNQVTTVTGANAITGEANLTFDGTTLGVTGTLNVVNSDGSGVTIEDHKITTNASNADLYIDATGSGNVVINGINFLTSGEMISKSKATALAIALG